MAESDITPNANARFLVREAVESDRDAIRQLFNRVFGEEMTQAHWHWKYDRPLSRAIVVYEDDSLVAHYGGVGSEALFEGKPCKAIQISDLMVDKSARHAVRTISPFYLSASAFLEKYVGVDQAFLLAYGFPSKRAMTLSEKLKLYEPVGTMHEVRWGSMYTEALAGPQENIISVDASNIGLYSGVINQLWSRFAKGFSNHLICVKNEDYFRWRYLAHPVRKYSLYIVLSKLLRRPIGLFVLRHDQGKSMLMDVLAKSMDLGKIIQAAKHITARHGNEVMITWVSNQFCESFASAETTIKALPIIIPANIKTRGPATALQKDKWWLMPGDTDYQ